MPKAIIVAKGDDLCELVKAINAIKSGYTFFPDLTVNSVRRNDVEASELDLIQSHRAAASR